MNKIYLSIICTTLLSSFALKASPQELHQIMKGFVDGNITKEDFLFHVKKTNFPSDVRDVKLVTNEYGAKTVRWYFTFTTEEVFRNVASVVSKKFSYSDLACLVNLE